MQIYKPLFFHSALYNTPMKIILFFNNTCVKSRGVLKNPCFNQTNAHTKVHVVLRVQMNSLRQCMYILISVFTNISVLVRVQNQQNSSLELIGVCLLLPVSRTTKSTVSPLYVRTERIVNILFTINYYCNKIKKKKGLFIQYHLVISCTLFALLCIQCLKNLNGSVPNHCIFWIH